MSPGQADKYQSAVEAFRRGDFQRTQSICREILRVMPKHFDSLHLLGVSQIQAGQSSEGIKLITKALEINPGSAEAFYNLGLGWFDQSNYLKASDCFRKAIVLCPDDPEYHLENGNAFQKLSQYRDALASYEQALRLRPGYAKAHNCCGVCLRELDRPEEALACYKTAIGLQPRYAEAYGNLGNVLVDLTRYGEAVASFDEAIRLKPQYVEAYYGIGNAFRKLEKRDAALRSYEKAVSLRPGFAEAHNGKGSCLADAERWSEAIACIDRALTLKPDYAEAHSNKANVLRSRGDFDEAMSSVNTAIRLKPDKPGFYNNRHLIQLEQRREAEALLDIDRAIELDPTDINFKVNKGYFLLRLGNFEEGLRFHEFRKEKLKDETSGEADRIVGAKELTGKKVYIEWEQGFGDTIQFCRYIPLYEQICSQVCFAVQPALRRLLSGVGSMCSLVDMRELKDEDLASFDVRISLLSSMLVFKTNLNTIPSRQSYLCPEEGRVVKWRNRLERQPSEVLVGVCWQGSKNAVDRGRSFPLQSFYSISKLPNLRLISLHKGEGEEQLNDIPPDMKIETLGEGFDAGEDAFVDSAAVMKLCDLVITSDTAIAHLAGALGVRTWVALKYTPDWRWLLDRMDSPWYPTMRLFRQKRTGDWSGVFEEIEFELGRLLRSASNSQT